MSTTSQEVRLGSRPHGWPTLENFTLARVELPPLKKGQALVRNTYMSVDPYMRGRMNDVPSYVPPFQVGQVLEGGAVGEVIESNESALQRGDIVTSNRGWREAFVATPDELQRVEQPMQPTSLYLGVLGMPGLTAWAGLRLVDVKKGDCIFISAAAGAVGSVAGQLAKLRGCRAIGSVGSSEKVKLLTHELGFDAAFNYHDGNTTAQLQKAAPDGIDVYFDLVGGEQLEAALTVMRMHGRIIACGAIAQYNETTAPAGPRNLALMIGKRLTMKGMIAGDWFGSLSEFRKEVGGDVVEGKLKSKETVRDGLAAAPQAFLDMMHGGNIGKMIVKLGGAQ